MNFVDSSQKTNYFTKNENILHYLNFFALQKNLYFIKFPQFLSSQSNALLYKITPLLKTIFVILIFQFFHLLKIFYQQFNFAQKFLITYFFPLFSPNQLIDFHYEFINDASNKFYYISQFKYYFIILNLSLSIIQNSINDSHHLKNALDLFFFLSYEIIFLVIVAIL